jgi:predicted small integral membrane protein
MKSIRFIKILLVASLALLLTITTLNNLTMPGAAYGAIGTSLSMSTTFQNPMEMWRAIHEPALLWIVYGLIVLGEGSGAVVCWTGAVKMWNARATAATFNRSKSVALIGLGIVAMVYLLGWLVLANEWFGMWQSQKLNTLPDAFRLFGEAMLISLWINTTDE